MTDLFWENNDLLMACICHIKFCLFILHIKESNSPTTAQLHLELTTSNSLPDDLHIDPSDEWEKEKRALICSTYSIALHEQTQHFKWLSYIYAKVLSNVAYILISLNTHHEDMTLSPPW